MRRQRKGRKRTGVQGSQQEREPEKVVIAGGGPGGMEAARILPKETSRWFYLKRKKSWAVSSITE